MQQLFNTHQKRCRGLCRLLAVVLLTFSVTLASAYDQHIVIDGVPYFITPETSTEYSAVIDEEAIMDGTAKFETSITLTKYITYNGHTYTVDLPQLTSDDRTPFDSKYVSQVEYVTIGKGIKTINSNFFSTWVNLRRLFFVSTDITTIAKDAFKKTYNLARVDMEAKANQSSGTPGVLTFGESCFADNQFLSTVILPTGRSYRFEGSGQFANCPELKSVTLPEGLTENSSGLMLPSLFSGCESLTSLNILVNVPAAKISPDAFLCRGGYSPTYTLTDLRMPFDVRHANEGDDVFTFSFNLKDSGKPVMFAGAADRADQTLHLPTSYTIDAAYAKVGLPTEGKIVRLADNCLRNSSARTIYMPKEFPVKMPTTKQEEDDFSTQAPLNKNCFNYIPGNYKKGLKDLYFYTEDGRHLKCVYSFALAEWSRDTIPSNTVQYAEEQDDVTDETVVIPYAFKMSNMPTALVAEVDKNSKYDDNAYIKNIKFIRYDRNEGTAYTKISTFNNCPGLTELVIPDNIIVGSNSFTGCTNLKKVTVESDQGFGKNAFADCTSLAELNVNSNLKYCVGEGAFKNCTSLKSLKLTFDGGDTSGFVYAHYIGEDAFSGCKNLKTVELKGCCIIYQNAFSNCWFLSTVRLGNRLAEMYKNVFNGTNIKSFVVPNRLDIFKSGCLGSQYAFEAVVLPKGASTSGLLSEKTDKGENNEFYIMLRNRAKRIYCPLAEYEACKNAFSDNSTKEKFVPYVAYKELSMSDEYDTQYCTVCSEYPIDATKSYNIKQICHAATVYEDSQNIKLKKCEPTESMKCMPYVAQRGTDDDNRLMVFAAKPDAQKEEIDSIYMLTGIGSEAKGYYETGDYILQSDNIFHRVTEDNTFAKEPNSAYITKQIMWHLVQFWEGKSSDKVGLLFEGDKPSGIDTLPSADGGTDGRSLPMYNLSGQRITAPAKGQPYIQGGKKHVMR